MNIVVASAFRNSAHSLRRYFKQVESLRGYLAADNHTLRVIAGEGDSVDNTRYLLSNYGNLVIQVVDTTHGGPVFGSTEQPERLRIMSKVGNQLFEAVQPTDDILVYVESDLVWNPLVLTTLVNKAIQRDGGFDIFAPMVFAGQFFYDIWGFRKDGIRFGPFPPYHPGINGDELVEVESAGSCLVMHGDAARSSRIRNDYCLVGWCEDARANGYRIAACPGLKINHP